MQSVFYEELWRGTKNKSASPIFSYICICSQLYTLTTKKHKTHQTPNNTTKLHITHQKFKIVPLIEKPKKNQTKKHRHNLKKMRYKNPKFPFHNQLPHYKNPIKSTKITHLHSDTKITYKNATKKDLRISTKVFNSIPLQSQTNFYQIIAFYTSFL